MKWSNFRRDSIAGPVVAAATLRIALAAAAYARTGTSVITQGDTASYLEPGWNLFHLGLYASRGLPELDRTPGYPIFVMLTGMLWGNVLSTVLAQIVLSVASVILVSRIAAKVFQIGRASCRERVLVAV